MHYTVVWVTTICNDLWIILMHGSKRLLSTVGTIRWWTIKMFHVVSVQYCRYFMQVIGKKTHAAGILSHIWDRDFELCVILYEVASTASGWIRYDDRTAGCERQMVRPLHSQHWITFSVRNARRDKSRSELWTIHHCTTWIFFVDTAEKGPFKITPLTRIRAGRHSWLLTCRHSPVYGKKRLEKIRNRKSETKRTTNRLVDFVLCISCLSVFFQTYFFFTYMFKLYFSATKV